MVHQAKMFERIVRGSVNNISAALTGLWPPCRGSRCPRSSLSWLDSRLLSSSAWTCESGPKRHFYFIRQVLPRLSWWVMHVMLSLLYYQHLKVVITAPTDGSRGGGCSLFLLSLLPGLYIPSLYENHTPTVAQVRLAFHRRGDVVGRFVPATDVRGIQLVFRSGCVQLRCYHHHPRASGMSSWLLLLRYWHLVQWVWL